MNLTTIAAAFFLSAALAMAGTATLGNNPAGGGSPDGYSAILVVDETDPYINTSGGYPTGLG